MQKLALTLVALLAATAANGADYKTLRNLNAPPPIQVDPLPAGAKARPVQFVRAVIEPRVGEAWALAY